MIDIDRSLLIGRAGALAILALILALVSPVLIAPFSSYADKVETIARERNFLSQAQARLAEATALGAGAPFVRATDRQVAFRLASATLVSSVPSGSMRLASFAEVPAQGNPKRLDISVEAEATPSGLRDFANALAQANPPMVISSFKIAAQPAAGPVAEMALPTRLNVQLIASSVIVKEDAK